MKQVVNTVFVVIGAATLAALALIWLALLEFGGLKGFLSKDTPNLLIGATIVCLGLGGFLWKRWQVVCGEVWVVVGSFLVGVASRSGPAEAELLGIVGLCSFAVGYLVVKRAADRNIASEKGIPKARERALQRMLEDSTDSSQPREARLIQPQGEFVSLTYLSVEQ
jgi:hypothetical protein